VLSISTGHDVAEGEADEAIFVAEVETVELESGVAVGISDSVRVTVAVTVELRVSEGVAVVAVFS
jgi:hypothetical protein